MADQRDQVIDFWRGISISFVVVHHLLNYRFFTYFETTVVHLLAFINPDARATAYWSEKVFHFSFYVGSLGVKMFFVISGYIITKLLINEESRYGRINIAAFYVRRILRIIPALMFFLAGVALCVQLDWISFSWPQFAYALSFSCNLPFASCDWFIGHLWSLSIEEQFYLFWPILFALLAAKRTAFLVAAICLFLGLSWFGKWTIHGWMDNALCFACIASGALCARSEKFRAALVKKRSPIYPWMAWVVLVSIPFASMISSNGARILLLLSPFAILVAIFSLYGRDAPRTSAGFRLIVGLGPFSYSLYLWQQLFLGPASWYPHFSPLQVTPLLIAFPLLSYLLIEKPLIRRARIISTAIIETGNSRTAGSTT